MKSANSISAGAKPIWFMAILLFFTYMALPENASAQSCSGSTPAYTLDFTGTPDTTWTSPSVSRSGLCCGKTGSTRCIVFYITLDSNAVGIVIDAVGGLGATDYEIDCSNATPLGSTSCIYNTGSFNVTICKPGGNSQQYTVKSIPRPYAPIKTAYIAPGGCTANLEVLGMVPSSVTWSAIGNSTYNSALSCTSGCSTTVVTRSASFPSYVDFEVCGTPASSCLSGTYCDTIRVYNIPVLDVSISPSPAYVCAGTSATTITAAASGGKAPYTYKWSTGSTDSTISIGTGTYVVTAKDAMGCQIAKDTVVVSSTPNPSPAINGQATICEDEFYIYSATTASNRSYSWVASGGTIIGSSTGSSVEVAWGSTGTKTLSLTETNTLTGCFGQTSKTISVIARPGPNTITH